MKVSDEHHRMNITASWAFFHDDGTCEGQSMILRFAADIAELVAKLSNPRAGSTRLEHSAHQSVNPEDRFRDHDVLAVVADDFAYISYLSPELGKAYSVGDPSSRGYAADNEGFPPGSGVPLATFTAALVEWLNTAERPTMLQWQEDPYTLSPEEEEEAKEWFRQS